jgi:hypothetical protein
VGGTLWVDGKLVGTFDPRGMPPLPSGIGLQLGGDYLSPYGGSLDGVMVLERPVFGRELEACRGARGAGHLPLKLRR